jgi:transposase
MNGPKYKEILRHNLLPYSNSFMPEEWIFQHDNDPKHTSKVVKDWLASNRIQVLKWPAQSPDLNPIENLWKELGHRVGSRNHSNRVDLLQHLQEEWAKIPSDFLEKLIESMPRRCEAIIASKGIATKY